MGAGADGVLESGVEGLGDWEANGLVDWWIGGLVEERVASWLVSWASARARRSSVCASRAALSGRFHRVMKWAALGSAASRFLPSQWTRATKSAAGAAEGGAGGSDFLQPPQMAAATQANKPKLMLLVPIARRLLPARRFKGKPIQAK